MSKCPAVFGDPKSGGVVLVDPRKEPEPTRRVRVSGYVTVRIYIDEEFDHAGTDDEAKGEALDRADLDGEVDSEYGLFVEDVAGPKLLRPSKVRQELEAWINGEPIKG